MNCTAASISSFIAGAVAGGVLMLFLTAITMATIYKEFAGRDLRRLRRVEKAAHKLYNDDRIEGMIAEDAPEDSPVTTYEIPADVWERFEKVVEEDED